MGYTARRKGGTKCIGNVKNHEAKRRRGRLMCRLENNIKVDLKEMCCVGSDKVETLSKQSSVVGFC
jgi:hypothetical protein